MGIKARDRLYIGLVKSLDEKRAFGESKYHAKKANEASKKIFSYKTYSTYKSDCRTFATWAYDNYKCKSMQQAYSHVKEFCERSTLSGWTQQKYACALSKAYGCDLKSELGLVLKKRSRAKITRSRGPISKHFSEERNKALVEFCKSTGLRRHELQMLEGKDLVMKGKNAYIHVRKGKGGKERWVPVLDNNTIVIAKMQASEGLVWGTVHSHAPIHKYRRDYANARYRQLARDIKTLDRSDLYYARKDMAGSVYDKKAMLQVSRELGHNRLDVIANNYLDHQSAP